VRIENCFAHKKGKWRRTKYLHALHQEIVVNHIVATAVLHNFVIFNGEEFEGLVNKLFGSRFDTRITALRNFVECPGKTRGVLIVNLNNGHPA